MIFGNRQSVVTESYKGKMGFIIPTSECFDEIITESAKDSYKLRAATYVSDILMEEAVMEGANSEILLEGFGRDLWEKIKTMFKKLVAKIKEWYNAFKRALALLITSGKEFVTKFEKELLKKNAKGYKYKTFKYTIGAAESKFKPESNNSTDEAATQALSGLDKLGSLEGDDLKNVDKIKQIISGNMDSFKADDDFDASECNEHTLSEMGVDSVEELISEYKEACRNGETSPEEFEDFKDCPKATMMKTIKEGDKAIKAVEKGISKIEADGAKAVRAFEKAQNSFKGEQLSAVTPAINFLVEVIRWSVATGATLQKTKVSMMKEEMKAYETILKGYLRFKPVKESYSSVDEEGAESILESAMRFV